MNFLKKIFKRISNNYISPEDQFVHNLMKKFPFKSASQRFEIDRANRVAYLRDHAITAEKDSGIWKDF